MQPGGRRVLVIPGSWPTATRAPAGIVPDETLVFVVDLIRPRGTSTSAG